MRQMTYVNFSAGELVESKPKLVHLCTDLYIRNRSNNAFQPFWLTWHHLVYSVYILSRSKPDALVINHDASWDTSGNRIWNVQFLKIQNFGMRVLNHKSVSESAIRQWCRFQPNFRSPLINILFHPWDSF